MPSHCPLVFLVYIDQDVHVMSAEKLKMVCKMD